MSGAFFSVADVGLVPLRGLGGVTPCLVFAWGGRCGTCEADVQRNGVVRGL